MRPNIPYILYLLLMFFLVACLLVLICKINSITTSNSLDFALVLTAMTVAAISAIVVPHVALKTTVTEEVRAQTENIKSAIKKEYDEEGQDRYGNEIFRADAHLSRMVAYFLMKTDGSKDKPLWAMGWMLRSARRYLVLKKGRVDIESYKDLIEMLKSFSDEATKTWALAANTKSPPPSPQHNADSIQAHSAIALVCDHLGPINAADHEERRRIMVRYLKDYFDLEVALQRVLSNCDSMQCGTGTRRDALEAKGSTQLLMVGNELLPLLELLNRQQVFVLACMIAHLQTGSQYAAFAPEMAHAISSISYAGIWDLSDMTKYQKGIGALLKLDQSKLTAALSEASGRVNKIDKGSDNCGPAFHLLSTGRVVYMELVSS